MFRKLLRSVGAALVAASQESVGPRKGAGDVGTKKHKKAKKVFAKKANAMVARNGEQQVAGAVHLIGMQEIKRELGPAWPHVSERADRVIEAVMACHLGADDIFVRQDEETYVVCFAEPGEEAARDKARRIVADTSERLRSEVPETNSVRVQQNVTTVPLEALEGGASVVDAIAAMLDQVRAEALEVEARLRRAVFEESTAVYRPIWSPVLQAVTMFRCTLDDATVRTSLRQLFELADPPMALKVMMEVDCLLMGRAIGALHELARNGDETIVVVPVSFHTINRPESSERFLSLCERIAQPYRTKVIFEIYGAPPRTSASQLATVAAGVSEHCLGVVLELSRGHQIQYEILKGTAYGIAFDLKGRKDTLDETVATASRPAHAAGLKVFVHEARTLGVVDATVRANVDFVDGEAISPKLSTPSRRYSLKLGGSNDLKPRPARKSAAAGT